MDSFRFHRLSYLSNCPACVNRQGENPAVPNMLVALSRVTDLPEEAGGGWHA
jgi:hypothetical protein